MVDAFETLKTTRRALIRLAPAALSLAVLAGCGSTTKNDTFDLSVADIDSGRKTSGKQILVTEPTALKALDSEQVLVRVSSSEVQYLSKAQWSDRLPRMVQARLVQAFENSGRLAGVGKPGQGLAIDDQVVSDIRAFEIDASTNRARVEISVKILNDRNGTVRAAQIFKAEAPAGSGNPALIRALDSAFEKLTLDIVAWTLTKV